MLLHQKLVPTPVHSLLDNLDAALGACAELLSAANPHDLLRLELTAIAHVLQARAHMRELKSADGAVTSQIALFLAVTDCLEQKGSAAARRPRRGSGRSPDRRADPGGHADSAGGRDARRAGALPATRHLRGRYGRPLLCEKDGRRSRRRPGVGHRAGQPARPHQHDSPTPTVASCTNGTPYPGSGLAHGRDQPLARDGQIAHAHAQAHRRPRWRWRPRPARARLRRRPAPSPRAGR